MQFSSVQFICVQHDDDDDGIQVYDNPSRKPAQTLTLASKISFLTHAGRCYVPPTTKTIPNVKGKSENRVGLEKFISERGIEESGVATREGKIYSKEQIVG